MNLINTALSTNEDFKFVHVVYDLNRPKSEQKSYTYKTFLDVTEGEFLVVPTQQANLEVVQVVKVSKTYETTANLKWVIAKVDFTAFDAAKAMEQEITALIADKEEQVKLKELNKNLIEALGKDGVKKAKAIIGKTRL